MKRTLRNGLAGCIALCGMAVAAVAAPVDPSRVPADAKWLIHIDIEEAQTTPVAQETGGESRVQKALGWIQERYGIDVGNDMRGATIFGTSYEPHTGVAVLNTAYSEDKVTGVMKREPGYKTTSLGDETLHSWTVTTPAREGQPQKLTMHAVLRDDQILIGRSEAEIRKALEVQDGQGKTLAGSDSPLLKDLPQGTFFRGAAVDLAKLRERPGFRVLPQLERITVNIGDREGEFFLDSKMIAEDVETAEQIKNLIEGFRATLALQKEENKELAELAEALKVSSQKETVTLEWSVSLEKLNQLVETAQEMREQREPGRSAGRPAPERN
jgi:hypothetical protein